MPATKKIIIRSFPLDLKTAIADEVTAGSYRSMNDAIRYALSEKFRVKYDSPTVGQNAAPTIGDTPRVTLTLDTRLDAKIENAAHRAGTTKRNVIVETLCEAFDVPFVPSGRWPAAA